MRGTTRFSVSLPSNLLDAVDKHLVKGGESRSALVRRLLERALREAVERDEIETYVRGYREKPQTDEEFGWSEEVAQRHLGDPS